MSNGKMMGRFSKIFDKTGLTGESSWSFYKDDHFICKITLDELKKEFPYLSYYDMANIQFGQLMLKKVKYTSSFN